MCQYYHCWAVTPHYFYYFCYHYFNYFYFYYYYYYFYFFRAIKAWRRFLLLARCCSNSAAKLCCFASKWIDCLVVLIDM